MSLPLPNPLVSDPSAQRNFEALSGAFPLSAIQVAYPVVTSLPGSPVNGQVAYYLADSTNGVVWTFKYRAASASAYKWEFVGGSPLFAAVETDESTASTTYAALATAGPSVTVPLAGDYFVSQGAEMYADAVRNLSMSFDIGGTGAVDADRIIDTATAATAPRRIEGTILKTGLAASTALVSKYKTNAGTGNWLKRRMRVVPVRVG